MILMAALAMPPLVACGPSENCIQLKQQIRDELAEQDNLPPEYEGEPCGDLALEPHPYYEDACGLCFDACSGTCVLALID